MDGNIWLWILQGFLALLFLGTGVLKLTRTRDEIVAQGLAWAEDYSEPALRALGWAEVLGAVGLVVPPLVGLGMLTPVAASCLTVLTVGAIVVHVRRREFLPDVVRTLALIALCATVAYGRFGPAAF
ncbi:DoxX family protein [Nocardioides sp. YIM 152315]|uniref:DoxX family protein n=1 Tax=Nocardioides sp. YIM 152315 TaxID=3031760 RepID=UPI0023DC99E3|nr:DoxX family protein [Nocardioides sp. YIM 152315]MDF1606049.1 DoxX family protein [Nocardioides sp. YIM 152315]